MSYLQEHYKIYHTHMQEGFKRKYFITSYLLFTAIGMLILGWKFFVLLGFINGDGLGTTLESVEILLFIGVALLWL